MSTPKQVSIAEYKTPSTYVYSPSGVDTQLWSAVLIGRELTSQQSYRPNQVESLLNSAADLLDRCLRNKREVEELLAREASLAFDLRLEAIRQNFQVDSTAYQSALLRASEKVDTRNRTSTFNSDIDSNGTRDPYLRPPLQLVNSQITAWEWLLKEGETKSEKHQGTASLNAAIFSAIQHVISRDSQSEQLAALRDAIDRSNLRTTETTELLAAVGAALL